MAKPNDPPTSTKPEQLTTPAPAKKAPIHRAVHCREETPGGEFIVVEVSYSSDAPAREAVIFRHASSAIASAEYNKHARAVITSLIHPTRFATRADVVPSTT